MLKFIDDGNMLELNIFEKFDREKDLAKTKELIMCLEEGNGDRIGN
jgi:hypothetical protein